MDPNRSNNPNDTATKQQVSRQATLQNDNSLVQGGNAAKDQANQFWNSVKKQSIGQAGQAGKAGKDGKEQEVLQPEEDVFITMQNKGAGLQNKLKDALSASNQPGTCFAHLLFKAAALGMFIFCALFFPTDSNVNMIILFLAVTDFWIVKNVTGRRLVGLRWWSEVNEKLEDDWQFECHLDTANINPFNSKCFWRGQILYCLITTVLLGLLVLSFNQTAFIRLSFMFIGGGVNLYAFYKCSKQQKVQVKKLLDLFKHGKENHEMYASLAKAVVKMPLSKK